MAKLTVSFVFILLEIFLVRPSSSVALNELIPFGQGNGDALVPQGDDSENSGTIKISTPFPFFGKYFTSLYVNINGVITFNKPFSKYVPKPFPLDGTTMIASFWADIDTRKGGAIWYRQTTSRLLLEKASMDVREVFPEFPQFSAKWMFVATWEKVPFFETKNENITNTFQAVLLTDGRYSFVRFNYHNITWTSARTSGGNDNTGLGGTEAGCGFNAGFGNYSYDVTTNSYRSISVLDLPRKTNVNKPGVWMFRTDNIAIQEEKMSALTPFGQGNGDILLPGGDDSSNSGKVDITTTFHFFGKYFTSLYVNINGVITFNKPFSEYKPKPFPVDGTTMIAPFWADVDTTKNGAIWYRQTTSKYLLEKASVDIREAFPEIKHFSAKWMFVATWEKVPFYSSKNENITNTFQSVLLTDGRYSFVRFNYHSITLTSATTSGLGGTEAGCGFNAGFGKYSYDVTTNRNRKISVLDLPRKTNFNKPGVWLFRTDGITIKEGKNSLDHFIPFGEDSGDLLFGDKWIESINTSMKTIFPFLGKEIAVLFAQPQRGVIVADLYAAIAPFYASYDTRNRGRIWYRQTTSKNELEVASTDVRTKFSEFPHFLANWMLVVTWDKVPFMFQNVTNTFQTVLLTDGRYSFVRFNYHEITGTSLQTIKDKEEFLSSIRGMSGFAYLEQSRYSLLATYNHNGSITTNITLWDLSTKTNVGTPGVWMFRTDEPIIKGLVITNELPPSPTFNESTKTNYPTNPCGLLLLILIIEFIISSKTHA